MKADGDPGSMARVSRGDLRGGPARGLGADSQREERILPPERRGLRIVRYAVIAIAVILALRLTYIQTVRRGFYLRVAQQLHRPEAPEAVPPGKIYDIEGRTLAEAEAVADLKVDMVTLRKSEKLQEVRQYLRQTLAVSPQRLEAILKSSRRGVYLARRVPLAQAEQVRAQRFRGLNVEYGYKRIYPYGPVGCHLLGAYSSDQRPLAGLDLQYRFVLVGQPGTPRSNVDAFGRTIVGLEGQASLPPVPGKSLVTTLDLDVQRTVEAALDRLWKKNRPETATAVVMNPRTGAVLALAGRPNYDPNDISSAEVGVTRAPVSAKSLTDLPVSWGYEPGSTLKVLTLAAGLETGAVTPASRFYCAGTMELGGRPLSCWGDWAEEGHGHGWLDLSGILAESCNLGAAQVATRIGGKDFTNFLRQCGLGQRTGLGLPGEARGRLHDSKSLYLRDVANMGFGQHLSVTPVQLVAAISAVVNDGRYMQPQLVRRVLNAGGSVYYEMAPTVKRMVCSPEVSRLIRRMMVGAVERGTGKAARIPGVAIGGKTGTAQIWDPNTRSFPPGEKVVSFVLIAPADRVPDFCILVTAKNPRIGEHGAEVAAPVCREIALYMLRRSGILPLTPGGDSAAGA